MPRTKPPAKSPLSPPSDGTPSLLPPQPPPTSLHPSFCHPHPSLEAAASHLLPILRRWSPVDFGRHAGHFLHFFGCDEPHRLFPDIAVLGSLIHSTLLEPPPDGRGDTTFASDPSLEVLTPFASHALSTILSAGASPHIPGSLGVLLCRYALASLLLPPTP